jgi:hypothetical protein
VGVRALRAAFKGKQIVSKDQRTPYDDDDSRYVSVEE